MAGFLQRPFVNVGLESFSNRDTVSANDRCAMTVLVSRGLTIFAVYGKSSRQAPRDYERSNFERNSDFLNEVRQILKQSSGEAKKISKLYIDVSKIKYNIIMIKNLIRFSCIHVLLICQRLNTE